MRYDEYAVVLKNGNELMLRIPSNWRVTFAPALPGRGGYDGNRMGAAVRVYRSGNKFMGIIPNVISIMNSAVGIVGNIHKPESTNQPVSPTYATTTTHGPS